MKQKKIISKQEQHWNEWFSGLIDGDGCLLISKSGYISLEITMSIYDENTLLQIQKKLKGSIKIRTNAKAFRYRLHHKNGMIKALNKLNGLCRNSKRIIQLQKLCKYVDIFYKNPVLLTLNSAWFCGFFDADGTLGYYFANSWPQLEISVSNKKAIDCEMFKSFFNGNIYLDQSSNTYKWVILSNEDILFFYNYLQKYPLQSYKQKRVLLIPDFFKLRNIGAYNYPKETKTYKNWEIFKDKWSFN